MIFYFTDGNKLMNIKEKNVQIQILQIWDIKLCLISSHFKDEKRKENFISYVQLKFLGQ